MCDLANPVHDSFPALQCVAYESTSGTCVMDAITADLARREREREANTTRNDKKDRQS